MQYVQPDALVVIKYVQPVQETYVSPVTCAAPQPATESTEQPPMTYVAPVTYAPLQPLTDYISDLNPDLHPSPNHFLQIHHGTKQLPRVDDGEQSEYGVVETHAIYAGTSDAFPHQSNALPRHGVAEHI